MKKILIPTDFSECATNAVELGIELAKKAKSEIHFLHILKTPVDWGKLRKEQEKNFPETLHQIGKAKAELTDLKKKAEQAGLSAKTFLVFDKDNDEIIDHLEYHKHDFIVMGSHGVKGFFDVIGSNTQKVVRNSPVPVLVVKEASKKNAFKNIVFASNFEEGVHQPFRKVLEFVDLMNANIHLLYVNLPDDSKNKVEMESIMKENMKGFDGVSYTTNVYNSINELDGILQFSKSVKADLITMITHGKSGFHQLISPSITENVVNNSNIPVLSMSINTRNK